jgi:hypothetical protein
MPAWPVSVTVLKLLLGGAANAGQLNIKVEGLTRERMISVQGDIGFIKLYNTRWDLISLRGYEFNNEANGDIIWKITLSAGKGDNHLLISIAVSLIRGDLNLESGTGGFANERVLKTRNYLSVAVKIHKGIATLRGIEHLPSLIRKGIVECHDGIFCDEGEVIHSKRLLHDIASPRNYVCEAGISELCSIPTPLGIRGGFGSDLEEFRSGSPCFFRPPP